MATEFDRNFISNNLLESEDWACMSESKIDELQYSFKLYDDFGFDEIQSDMMEPEVSDGSDSGVDSIDILSMKPEPLSPSSLFTDTKAEPQSPVSLTSESSSDSVSYALSSTDGENLTEISQEDWDSIQSLIFEQPDIVTSLPVDQVSPVIDYAPDVQMMEQVELPMETTYVVPSTTHAFNGLPKPLVIPNGSSKALFPTVGTPKVTVISGLNKPVNGLTKTVALSNTVKIKPKPLSSLSLQASDDSTTPTAVTRPVVTLTKTVTSQSVPAQPRIQNVASMPIRNTTSAAPTTVIASPDVIFTDVRALKRHQRMIKNRESACLSRKRKKDYMQSLEQQLNSYSSDNERLKAENMLLKRKVEHLQNENDKLKRSLPMVKAAGISVLLCVTFLSFNYLPAMLTSNGEESSAMMRPVIHTGSGRSLLSVVSDESPSSSSNSASAQDEKWSSVQHRPLSRSSSAGLSLLQDVKDLMISGSTFNSRYLCPSLFNTTESLRLVNELQGWVLSHEEELRRQREVIKMQQHAQTKTRKKYYAPRHLKAAMHGSAVDTSSLTTSRNELQLFKGSSSFYDDFMEAIHRRNDTFYVVSFRHDHLLLPAIAHNKTNRPRMSVMMPAVGLNDTMQPPVGSIAMMQIDCEVTATRLIHIEKSVVPADMMSNRTVTNGDPRSNRNGGWFTPPGRH